MNRFILAASVFIFIFSSVPAFTAPADAAKEALEKIKKDKEADLIKKQEQKQKAGASSAGDNTSIPGKLLFRGKVEKINFSLTSAQVGSVTFKLENGQTVTATYGKNFIMRKQPVGFSNISHGMKVAIVNPPPTITVTPGSAPDASAMQALLANCVISPASMLYFGNDADDLGQYYPAAATKPPAPAKR